MLDLDTLVLSSSVYVFVTKGSKMFINLKDKNTYACNIKDQNQTKRKREKSIQ